MIITVNAKLLAKQFFPHLLPKHGEELVRELVQLPHFIKILQQRAQRREGK